MFAGLFAAPLAFGAVAGWAWGGLAVLAAVIFLLWGVDALQRESVTVVWSPLYALGGLFLAFAAVQFWVGRTADPWSTQEAILKFATYLILFFVAGQLLHSASKQTWSRYGLAVAVYVLLLSLFAILQYFASPFLIYGIVKPRWGGWIFGPYVNHNHYAGLMEMLVPVAVACWMTRPRQDPTRRIAAFAAILGVVSVLLSGSRGGMLAIVVEACILIAVVTRRAPRLQLRAGLLPIALGLLIVAAGFLWVAPSNISKRLETVVELAAPSEVSFVYRKMAALDSFHMLRDHLWLGTGLGSFEYAFPKYQTFPSDAMWGHAHDDYAEAAAETGLVGIALIALAILLWFRISARGLGERLRHRTGWLQFGAMLGCCGLLVHSLADFNFHIPANAAWFAVLAAWAISIPKFSLETRSTNGGTGD
ncbi:MAG: O-antigen ligase family protein [Terriglobia bacterium]